MTNIVCLTLAPWAGRAGEARAQTRYVDAVNGRPAGTGTPAAPLASLEQAVALAQEFTGQEPVVLQLAPGLYILIRPAEIRTRGMAPDTARYPVEAAVLPDDPAWTPTKMPVIQSVAADGFTQPFAHAVGFLVARINVRFSGLKFVGNAHPGGRNYYPTNRKKQGVPRPHGGTVGALCSELRVKSCAQPLVENGRVALHHRKSFFGTRLALGAQRCYFAEIVHVESGREGA